MDKSKLWKQIMAETEVLRLPKRSIATFGPTDLYYSCLSAVGQKSTRLRQGVVRAEKPKIFLPDQIQEIFEGFEPKSREFAKELLDKHGKELKALGYTFKHEPKKARLLRKMPQEAFENLAKDTEEEPLAAIMKAPDEYWELAIVKLTIEMASKSFKGNVTELEERGFFNPEGRMKDRVELMFNQARKDKSKLDELARFLKSNNLFDQYEDRFFEVVKEK